MLHGIPWRGSSTASGSVKKTRATEGLTSLAAYALGRSYLGGCSPCPVSANARAASCSISYRSCSVSWSDVCQASSSPWPLRLRVEALKSHSRLLGVEQAERGTQLLDSAVWDASSSPVPSDSRLTLPRPAMGTWDYTPRGHLKRHSCFPNIRTAGES